MQPLTNVYPMAVGLGGEEGAEWGILQVRKLAAVPGRAPPESTAGEHRGKAKPGNEQRYDKRAHDTVSDNDRGKGDHCRVNEALAPGTSPSCKDTSCSSVYMTVAWHPRGSRICSRHSGWFM